MSDLQSLRDRQDVIDTVNRLFVAVDNRDWPAARAAFAESVHFDMTLLGDPAPATVTPEQITTGWAGGLAPLESVHHQSGNFLVTVEGDAATCFCYGIAYHFRRVRSGKNTRVFVGSYDYRLARRTGAWRITHFKFNAKFVDGNATLEREEPA